MRLLASAVRLWGAGAAGRGCGCLCFSSPRNIMLPPHPLVLFCRARPKALDCSVDHSSRVTLGG